jgi:hypothetical protein
VIIYNHENTRLIVFYIVSKLNLIVLGCGKSALVANWAGRLEEREPDTFTFLHFIGSTAESASYFKLLRR